MIDKSSQWWTGKSFADLAEYLKEYSAANGCGVAESRQSHCECGCCDLGLLVDDEEGCAARVCETCGTIRPLVDSGDYWDEADPGEAVCPCGNERFEIAVGFAKRDGGGVRWVYVGGRCTACGTLGCFADWSIDYSPTEHLLGAI